MGFLKILTLLQVVADSDMAGPLLIALLLGAAMLLRGKVIQMLYASKHRIPFITRLNCVQ